MQLALEPVCALSGPVRNRARPVGRVVVVLVLTSTAACGGGRVSTANGPKPVRYEIPPDVCEGIENSFECARAIESYQLGRGVEGVLRHGDRLVLTLMTGDSVSLADVEGVAGIAYSYQQFLPTLNHYLIGVHYWEGREYLLVHARSGGRAEIQAVPVISPDRARFVTASSDLEAEYRPTQIQIWRVRNDGLALEWSFAPLQELSLPSDSVWGPIDPVWLSAREIRIRKQHPFGRLGEYIRLRLEAEGWRLVEER